MRHSPSYDERLVRGWRGDDTSQPVRAAENKHILSPGIAYNIYVLNVDVLIVLIAQVHVTRRVSWTMTMLMFCRGWNVDLTYSGCCPTPKG